MSLREPVREKSFGEQWKARPSYERQRKVLTEEQREKGRTWVFHTGPERPYIVGKKEPSTTVLAQPETYKTWFFFTGPERPYVVGEHQPRESDVTLIAAPPSVRAELRQVTLKPVGPELQEKLYGVRSRLGSIEQSLRTQVIIQKQHAKGYELVGRDEGQLVFAPKSEKSIAERILEFDPWQMGFEISQRIFGREPSEKDYESSFLKGLSEAGFMRLPVGSSKAGTLEAWKPETWAKPQTVVSGIVSYPETLVYMGASLAGVKTPSLPQSYEAETQYPGYSFGRGLSEVGVSLLIGKAIELSPLGKPLAKAEMWVMSKVRKPLVGTALDKFLLQHSRYWQQLQEYSLGNVVFGGPPKKWSPKVYHGKTITPMKTTLAKAIADTKGSVLLPQLITSPKTLFTPSETTLPFSFLSQTLGFSAVLGSDVALKTMVLPTAKPIATQKMRKLTEVEQLERQFSIPLSIPRTRFMERAELFSYSSSITKVMERTTPILSEQQATVQAQKQNVMQVQKQILKMLSVAEIPQKPEKTRRKGKRRRKGKGVKFGFVTLEWPVATAEEFLELMSG